MGIGKLWEVSNSGQTEGRLSVAVGRRQRTGHENGNMMVERRVTRRLLVFNQDFGLGSQAQSIGLSYRSFNKWAKGLTYMRGPRRVFGPMGVNRFGPLADEVLFPKLLGLMDLGQDFPKPTEQVNVWVWNTSGKRAKCRENLGDNEERRSRSKEERRSRTLSEGEVEKDDEDQGRDEFENKVIDVTNRGNDEQWREESRNSRREGKQPLFTDEVQTMGQRVWEFGECNRS